jgi:YVTN family beta-propeller protein
VIATIPLFPSQPVGVAMTPDGSKVYVTSAAANIVSVIDTATNTVTATISIGSAPTGVAATPDGKVYVANLGSNNVSVIATATNTVTATVGVGTNLYALFIAPLTLRSASHLKRRL